MENKNLNCLDTTKIRNYILRDYHSFKNYILEEINTEMSKGDDNGMGGGHRLDGVKFRELIFVLYNFIAEARIYIPRVTVTFFDRAPILITFIWEDANYKFTLDVSLEIPMIAGFYFTVGGGIDNVFAQSTHISLREKREFNLDFEKILLEELTLYGNFLQGKIVLWV